MSAIELLDAFLRRERVGMLTEALTVLASTGGTALVTAMVTDGWEDVKARFAHLFGRGDAKQVEAAAGQLQQSHAALAGLSGPGLECARAEQEIIWRTRLGDLLEHDLPRTFRTADLWLIHAADCRSRYALRTCCGVRY